MEVPERTVQRWVAADGLPAQKIAGQLRFNRAELFEWATLRKLWISPDVFHENSPPEGVSVGISSALRVGGMLYDVPGADKREVLAAITRGLTLPEGFDREVLLELFLSRESMGSTAVGDGIAIPHPRYPVVLPLANPAASICFLRQPIDFDASDGSLVDTLFVMVGPTVAVHFRLLTQLACALRDAEFRRLIREKASPEAIVASAARFDVDPAGASARAEAEPRVEPA